MERGSGSQVRTRADGHVLPAFNSQFAVHYLPRTGTPVSVVGDLVNGSTIVVESFNNITSLLPSTAQDALKAPLRGAIKMLIITTRFTDGLPALTKQQVEQRIIAPAHVFLKNCSYGRVKLDPQVAGPVTIGPRAGCPDDFTANEWIATASAQVCFVVACVKVAHIQG